MLPRKLYGSRRALIGTQTVCWCAAPSSAAPGMEDSQVGRTTVRRIQEAAAAKNKARWGWGGGHSQKGVHTVMWGRRKVRLDPGTRVSPGPLDTSFYVCTVG